MNLLLKPIYIIIIFALVIILALSWRIMYLQHKSDRMSALVQAQNQSIAEWKRQSDLAQSRIVTATKNAEDVLKQNESLNALNQEVIPKDCDGAVKWGAIKAKELS